MVIFRYPDDESQIFIKRVIGLPGDKIEIADGRLIINGEAMVEDYVKEPMTGSFGPYEVPEGCYFMLGDNRNISQDSRYWKNTYVSRKIFLRKHGSGIRLHLQKFNDYRHTGYISGVLLR